MKKYLLRFAVLAMGMSLMTACSDDDEETPAKKAVTVANGLFIVGSGNMGANIDGNLTYIDYAKGTVTANAFKAANGKSVGKTANYGLIYGSKLYIVVDGENTIWVCDKNTLKVQKQVSTVQLLGESDGVHPRSAAACGGKLYFSCYGSSDQGVVAAIDTTSYQLAGKYTVGSYPDGVTVSGNSLYVANSDYGSMVKPSVSVIDLKAGTVKTITDENITNPMHLLTVGDAVYMLDYGTYDENWNQKNAGVRKITADGKVTKVVDGTSMGTDGTRIYTVNAPYGAATIDYRIYDTTTGRVTTWTAADVFSPSMIAADPVTGHIFVVSYQKDPDSGYPSYKLPSYTNEYDANGNLLKKYENTATGPISIVFNTGVKYE